jgi:hypothetical protein
MSPPLFAQNDALLFRVTPLPETESINGAILSKAITFPEKESIDDANTASPFSKIQSMQAVTFLQPSKKKDRAFWDFINKKVYEDTVKIKEEKRIIRQQWKESLGVDVWYPYFKAKEIEDWVCDKTKVEIFHLKGRIKFENNQIKYTFKMQF